MAGELGAIASNPKLAAACAALADRLDCISAMRAAFEQLDASITIGVDVVTIDLGAGALLAMIGADASQLAADHRISLSLPALLKRRGHELRLVYAAPDANPARRDDRLIKLIASGHEAYDRLRAAQGIAGPTERSTLTRLARLKFLAPDIVTAIVEGRQPVELTSRTLLRVAELPLVWDAQRRVLGFG